MLKIQSSDDFRFSLSLIPMNFIYNFLIIGVVYFFSIIIAFKYPNPQIQITPIWTTVGVALATFLLNPKKLWIPLMIVLFISGSTAFLFSGQLLENTLILQVTNIIGTLGIAKILIYLCGDSIKFTRINDILVLTILGIMIIAVTTFIAAFFITRSLGEIFLTHWITLVISNWLGIIVITPFIVLFMDFRTIPLNLNWKKVLEFGIFLIIWSIISRFMFSSMSILHPITLRPYMIIALLPWVAFRFGMRWVSFASLAMTLITITSPPVLSGSFLWGGDSLLDRFQILQIYLGITSTSGYLLAASYAEKKDTEKHLRQLINSALDAVITIDQHGIVIGWDSRSEAIFGWNKREALGSNVQTLIIPESLKDKHDKGMERYLATGIGVIINKHVELTGRHKNGYIFPVELSITPIKTEDNLVFTAFIRDITERKKSEEQLRKLSRAIERSASTIVITDIAGNIEYVNLKFIQITGYSFEEAIGKNPRILKSGHTSNAEYKNLWETVLSGGEWHGEFLNTKKNGEYYWESANISPIQNEIGEITHLLAVKEDITDRKKAEEALEKSLRQKELLLSEIHHRVKNNLQVVSSIISMEAHFIKDEEAAKHLNNTASRVHAMGLLHNKLYKSHDFSHIDMNDYLHSIIEYILSIQHYDKNKNIVKYDIHNIQMNIDTAMPCGLIINEIITNSLKYAFPQGTGEIGISIHFQDSTYTMKVYDNGIGIPSNTNFGQNSGLGMKLISSLTKQLHGTVTIERSKGTMYVFSFKEDLKEEKRWKEKK